MKNIKRSLIINALILAVSIFLFRSISYSASDKIDTDKDNKDLLFNTGNMQVVLSVPSNKYNIIDSTIDSLYYNVTNQKDYSFTIKNTGTIPIDYYEIRLVDQEGKISTLPHKYLLFSISKDNGKYEETRNLGDNDSIIYYGYNLGVGDSSSFNLKIWIDDNEVDAMLKELHGAIEVTLYQKFDVYKNYVLYDSPDSTNVPIRSSIYNPISTVVPKKDGYKFVGWETKDGLVKYNPGDTFKENIGTTLYALWEKE